METKTYYEYMTEHQDMGFDFCQVFMSEDGNHAWTEYGTEIIRVKSGDHDYEYHDVYNGITEIAKAVNPYYEDYKGWDDRHIAMEVVKRRSCYNCPWKHECDVMMAYVSEDDWGLETAEE